MKVSIIVPVYNAEKYLHKCLDSLVAQTLDDYEVILINDGSKDSSGEILKEYGEKYPEKIKHITVENGGQGRARNIGISMAQGEYLGFADSDDWVDPTMFEKLYNAARENDADMALCDCMECYYDGRENYFDMCSYANPMYITTAVWNKLFKKSLAENITFPEGLWYEDLSYVIEFIIRAKKIAPVHEALYFYRIGQTSTMTNNNSKKNLDILKILDGLKEKMLPDREEDFKILVLRHLLLDTVNRVAAHNNGEKSAVIAELRDYAGKVIPDLLHDPSFKRESASRRVVMFLNYNGMEQLSQFVFKLKKMLR